MRLLLSLLLLLTITSGNVFAQSDAMNLSKYWYYRYQLRHKFMKPGETTYHCVDPDQNNLKIGYSIPAAFARDNHIHWADATCDLGWYIGVLATEYRLLKKQGANTSYTEEELYYAMQAYERLDYHTEKNAYPYKGPCDLNGFFERDDVSREFANEYFLKYMPKGSDFASDYNSYNVIANNKGALASQDQIINLMMGFALVVKCVDATANFNGYNFVYKAKFYSDLLIGRLALYGYTMPIPYTVGEFAKYGLVDILPQAFALAKAGQKVQSGDWGSEIFPNSGLYENAVTSNSMAYWESIPNPVGIQYLDVLFKDHEYQVAWMQLLAAIGHSWKTGVVAVKVSSICVPYVSLCGWSPCIEQACVDIWCYQSTVLGVPVICAPFHLKDIAVNITGPTLSYTGDRYGQQLYALYHQYLHNGVNPSISNSTYKGFIDSAPCEGPHFFNGDHGVAGWRANNNRWSNPTDAQTGPSDEHNYGFFSGLDYMMLYNLYYLQNGTPFPYVNQLHLDINGNYPLNNSTHLGSDANPVSYQAFESIKISGSLNSGQSTNTNGNMSLRAPDGVDITNFSTAPGVTLTITSTPFSCNGGNGYHLKAPIAAPEEPKTDTAEQTKKYYEYIENELREEVKKVMPEIKKQVEQSRYEPVEDYVKRIEDESNDEKIYIYPNPSSGYCTLEFRIYEESNVEFSILDMYGKEVMKPILHELLEKGTHQVNFDVSALAAGTYVFKFKTDQIFQTGKFVKVNQ